MDFTPTPIHFLYEDENRNRIYVKREDLLPYSFGGNKVRIALELLDDMASQGCDHLIAYGNARSNLCRVLSNLCAGRGIPCTILSPADDDGETRESFNRHLCSEFGAEIVPCLKTGVQETVEAALRRSRDAGRKPYYIYGNSTGDGNLSTPVRAYRKVWDELLTQQSELGLTFDHLFHASGTGMTQSGLICGQLQTGGGPAIHGISIARSKENGTAHILRYIRAFMGDDTLTPSIDFADDYALSYGVYTPEMAELVTRTMRLHGLPLDLTYTGKAFSGMLGELTKRGIHGQNILFLHTGGTPLFFDSLLFFSEKRKEAKEKHNFLG